MTLNNTKGFSFVEVLIALIIMSVGMLGIAGLYVHSLQAGRTSMLRHQAVTLAGDIAEGQSGVDGIGDDPSPSDALRIVNSVDESVESVESK